MDGRPLRIRRRMRNLAFGLVLVSIAGCVPADDGGLAEVAAPAIGKADGTDRADHDCQVVLDQVAHVAGPDGIRVAADGRRFWVFAGEVLAAAAAGTPAVMYANADTGWWEVPTTRVGVDPSGLVRYRFELADATVEDGLSASGLARARVQLVPLLHDAAGGRLFDHNRITDDFGSYQVDQAGGWRIAADGTCTAPARTAGLRFDGDFTTQQRGAIVVGNGGSTDVTVDYNIGRLLACRGTHNGAPAWDIIGHARFEPSGELVSASVRGFDAPGGIPTGGGFAVPWTFTPPAGATSVALWFENVGIGCQGWDSNLGGNYVFPVLPASAAPATPIWAGDWGNGFNRACEHRDGLEEPTVIDSYIRERACMFVDADVYVPGLTDAGGNLNYVFGEASFAFAGEAATVAPLRLIGQAGNNARLRWTIDRSMFMYRTWTTVSYEFRFSTDGVHWLTIGPHTLTNGE